MIVCMYVSGSVVWQVKLLSISFGNDDGNNNDNGDDDDDDDDGILLCLEEMTHTHLPDILWLPCNVMQSTYMQIESCH